MAVLEFAVLVLFAVLVREVAATRWTVGGNTGWGSSDATNLTMWAQDKHFYNGDWLFFVYDRNQMSVLEVDKTGYEECNSDHMVHNWTMGAGRDVVPLNETRDYYFISGNGFCDKGVKVAVHVEDPVAYPPVNDHVENIAPSPSPGASQVNDPVEKENLPLPPEASPPVNGHVDNLPPPPGDSPVDGKSGAPTICGGQFVVLALVLGIGAWNQLGVGV